MNNDLARLSDQLRSEGALTLSEIAAQEGGELIAETMQQLLGVAPEDFGFFAPGSDSKNLYHLYRGIAVPLLFEQGVTYEVSGECMIDTPSGPRKVEFTEQLGLLRTSELSAQTQVIKRLTTEGASLALSTTIETAWTSDFKPGEMTVKEPLLLGHIEPLRLEGSIEQIHQAMNRRPVGTATYRSHMESPRHLGSSCAIDEVTVVEPVNECLRVITTTKQIVADGSDEKRVEVSWAIKHPKTGEVVLVEVSSTITSNNQTEIARAEGEIESSAESVFNFEGRLVKYKRVAQIERIDRKFSIVRISRCFEYTPGFNLREIVDEFWILKNKKGLIQKAFAVMREYRYLNGEVMPEVYVEFRIWPRIIGAMIGIIIIALIIFFTFLQ